MVQMEEVPKTPNQPVQEIKKDILDELEMKNTVSEQGKPTSEISKDKSVEQPIVKKQTQISEKAKDENPENVKEEETTIKKLQSREDTLDQAINQIEHK